jgi:hypothetical protein
MSYHTLLARGCQIANYWTLISTIEREVSTESPIASMAQLGSKPTRNNCREPRTFKIKLVDLALLFRKILNHSCFRDAGTEPVKTLVVAGRKNRNGLRFDIIGMGGVMNAKDVFAYQQAGAEVVQTATAAFINVNNANLPKDIIELLGGAPKSELTLEATAK